MTERIHWKPKRRVRDVRPGTKHAKVIAMMPRKSSATCGRPNGSSTRP